MGSPKNPPCPPCPPCEPSSRFFGAGSLNLSHKSTADDMTVTGVDLDNGAVATGRGFEALRMPGIIVYDHS